MEYLNEQFPDRYGPQNWPLRSPDLTHLDLRKKNTVYERKVNRRDELYHRISDAARRMNLQFQISVAP
jgi:hypothetical protein